MRTVNGAVRLLDKIQSLPPILIFGFMVAMLGIFYNWAHEIDIVRGEFISTYGDRIALLLERSAASKTRLYVLLSPHQGNHHQFNLFWERKFDMTDDILKKRAILICEGSPGIKVSWLEENCLSLEPIPSAHVLFFKERMEGIKVRLDFPNGKSH